MMLKANVQDTTKVRHLTHLCFFQVEPEGVEPSSKHAENMLSTSLVTVWLSAMAWYGTHLATAYLLKFRLSLEARPRLSALL